MAKIVSVRFPNADSPGRRAVAHSVRGIIHAMLANTRSGDHVAIHYDDGTTVNLVMKDANVNNDSLIVDVEEGVEP